MARRGGKASAGFGLQAAAVVAAAAELGIDLSPRAPKRTTKPKFSPDELNELRALSKQERKRRVKELKARGTA